MCLRGITPQTTTSLLLLFLSFFSALLSFFLLSHPTFIVNGWMSACIYPRLHSAGSSLIVRLWQIAGSCGNLLLSNQPFFRYKIILIATFIVYLMTKRFVLNYRLSIKICIVNCLKYTGNKGGVLFHLNHCAFFFKLP